MKTACSLGSLAGIGGIEAILYYFALVVAEVYFEHDFACVTD